MKNLKKINRNDLSKILGSDKELPPIDQCTGQYPYAIPPSGGACPTGYIFCSFPNCCFKIGQLISCWD